MLELKDDFVLYPGYIALQLIERKNELYNRPSYHYGDRLDCRRNGQGQKRDIGCLTCESCCDKKIAAVRGEMLSPVMLSL